MKKVNLVGLRFNRLLVIEKTDKRKNGLVIYLCRCDCGKEKEILGKYLTHNTVQSCECLRAERAAKQSKLAASKNIVTGDYNSAFNHLYKNYRRNAEIRNIEFLLSKEEFKQLTENNCNYCGNTPTKNWIQKGLASTYLYNGVDRIDNNIGYILDNCVTCCSVCNFMKGKLSKLEFLSQINKIHKHQGVIQECL